MCAGSPIGNRANRTERTILGDSEHGDVGRGQYAEPVSEDELRARLSGLEHEHHLTRWYTGRVDRDLAEIAATQQEHGEILQEHTGLLTSINSQMKALTMMVGQVLERLQEPGSDE
jgi:hypothetical protein